MRRVIGQRLQEAKTFIPHFYVRRQIDALPLIKAREQLHECGVKVSLNDFVVRACALALRKHPVVNSAFNSGNGTIAHFKTIDICVAVSIEGGLITPIIRHADFKNIGEISVEVRSLAARAKAGKLEAHEYNGGSFTMSNLGMYGVDDFIAVINPPPAAILAVGAVLDAAVVRDGQVVAGKVLNVTLSADHRVVDGVAAAQFLQTLKHYLQNPASLLLPS
jgi:pyruvate dehydrogenase E2 component (dihydrolipoamide acetyltransferase)